MRYRLLLCAGILIAISACNPSVPDSWTELVPDKTPFLILPEPGQSLHELLEAPYTPLLEDVSPAAVRLTGTLLEEAPQHVAIHAMLLYPDTSNDLKPVFVGSYAEGLAEWLANRYQEPFAQNRYRFGEVDIEILTLSERPYYLARIGPYAILSESSLAIEDMVRTWRGELPAIRLRSGQAQPGSYLVNTPNLERWVEQLVDIIHRPSLKGLFEGSGPVSLRPADSDRLGNLNWLLEGEIPIGEDHSALVHAVSAQAAPFLLDRYISSSASGYSLMFLEPRTVPLADPVTELDRFLAENRELYRRAASALHAEFAFVAFAESGFMSSSEYVLIRRLEDPAGLRSVLQELAGQNRIQRTDNDTFHISSALLGELIGSELSSMTGFYLAVHDRAAVLSRSNSLVTTIGSDFGRRRVVYYDPDYANLREDIDSPLSSFTYIDGPAFSTFLQPWLFPQNYAAAIGSSVELFTLSTRRQGRAEPLQLRIASHTRETTRAPYLERWTYPLSSDLSGRPVLADVAGSPREEIVFATMDGSVFVLAADGSPVMQASTGEDRPVGSPVVFDWYGNNQQMVMLAAGNRIYAWNEAGSLLPNFPVTLEERITTPLQVIDVTRNGVAEMIVGTEDRQIHILNARGNPIQGWPQTTNSVATSPPLVASLSNQQSVFVFTENGLHAWGVNGLRRNGFPIFIESRYNGSPAIHTNHLLGSAADGHLYATGSTGLFDRELAATQSGDSLVTRSINVGNSSLTSTPVSSSELVRVDDVVTREDLILVQSRNGAVQAYNLNGELRFTASMGQPAAETTGPVMIDINGNGRTEVVALAESGRLYAWDLVSGSRILELPASAMNHPLIRDMNRDGNQEIIAQTREGLRVWTVFSP